MKRAFIIHGWGGTPSHGWYPWMKEELEKSGFEAFVPNMLFKKSTYNEIIKKLNDNIKNPDRDTFLICHSAGCMAALKWIENLDKGQRIGGAVFVAAFTGDIGRKDVDSFFPKTIDWDKIKSHCKKFVAIQSDNDFFDSIKYGKVLEEKLGVKLIVEHNMGHFSKDDGITELPVAMKELLKIAFP